MLHEFPNRFEQGEYNVPLPTKSMFLAMRRKNKRRWLYEMRPRSNTCSGRLCAVCCVLCVWSCVASRHVIGMWYILRKHPVRLSGRLGIGGVNNGEACRSSGDS